MSYKTRENYAVTACIAPCANRDIKCDECLNKSEFYKITKKYGMTPPHIVKKWKAEVRAAKRRIKDYESLKNITNNVDNT